MYLHLGRGILVRKSDIVAVCDLDNSSYSHITRDYLARERIDILPAEQAKPQRYRLLGGGYVEEKPEHMTHLHSDLLVRKDHPRIVFRGKLDTLEAELILAQLDAPQLQEQLDFTLEQMQKMLQAMSK